MSSEIVDIDTAVQHLSLLLDRVESGEDVVIGRAGRPVARLVPYVEGRARVFGRMRGHIRILGDSREADDRILRDFETTTD